MDKSADLTATKGATASERIAARSNSMRIIGEIIKAGNSVDNQAVIEIDSDNDGENQNTRFSTLLRGKEKPNKFQDENNNMPTSTWNIGQMQGNMVHFTTSTSKDPLNHGSIHAQRMVSQDDIVAASYNIAARANDFVGGAIGLLPSEGVDVETCSTENSDEEGYSLQQMTPDNRYLSSNSQYIVTNNSGKNPQTVWASYDGSADPKLGTYVTASSGRNGQPVMQAQQQGIELCNNSPGYSGRQQLIPVMTSNGLTYQMASNPDMYYRQYSGNQAYGYGDHAMYSPTMVYREVPGGNMRNMKVVNVPQLPEQLDSDVWTPQDDSDEEGQDESDGRQSVCSDQPSTEKRKRKKKEPKKEKVKRPMNAFMVWAKKARSKVAKSFQAINNADVSVKLGETWSSMTPEEKQPYFDEANKIKEKHKRDHPDWVYQPKPKRKKTTGTGVTSLFAVTVNTKDNNIITHQTRYINTYKHAHAGLVFQNEASNLQVMQTPVMQQRFNNNAQNSCNAPFQMAQSGNVVMATPSQISQLQQQGLQILQMQGGDNMHYQMFSNNEEGQDDNNTDNCNDENEENVPQTENQNVPQKDVLPVPQPNVLEE